MDALLEWIQSPSHLKKLSRENLPSLAQELRERVVETVSQTGGHFSSNLGTVELTIALHYVFNTPEDRLVWDVGHQTYPHKILTGRNALMGSLRQKGGLSGFPRREESVYDAFGTAHSSTSISAALGMAVAHQQTGSSRKAVANAAPLGLKTSSNGRVDKYWQTSRRHISRNMTSRISMPVRRSFVSLAKFNQESKPSC